ncbi:MAG: hypothetical protein RTU30_00495 [Candidatus Thorarchaeota archaeon]
MTEKDLDEIRNLIDSMQSRLVQLFDELRELRSLLNIIGNEAPDGSGGVVVPLFSEATKAPDSTTDTPPATSTKPAPVTDTPESVVDDVATPIDISSIGTPTDDNETITSSKPPPEDALEAEIPPDSVPALIPNAKVTRVLDPIAHELRTGEAPAEVIAEYLQSAKDNLITTETPNERVARDIDVVLKFLRARGKKPIRPEERENILKRIRRWKANL